MTEQGGTDDETLRREAVSAASAEDHQRPEVPSAVTDDRSLGGGTPEASRRDGRSAAPHEGPVDGGQRPGGRRRWRRAGVAVAVVVAALVAGIAAGRYLWFPHYRPELRAGERYGVDVSHHQGGIDWARVAGDDIAFAYVKATEGADHVDRRFAENWEGAHAAGLDRGAYHFFTLCTPGRAQAEHFLRVVPDDEGALPPAVDLELAGNCAARPSAARVRRELEAFLEPVEEATGQRTVLYVGDDFESVYPVRQALDRPLWHRRILWRADVDGWWIWQFTGWAQVDGISGPADLNVMRRRP